MVEFVNDTTPTNRGHAHRSRPIVELVGVAGAGKTTLARALSELDEDMVVADDIGLRNRQHLSLFASQIPSLLPVLMRQNRKSRQFTWDEIKAMAYLKGWAHVLEQQNSIWGTAILLDHGPVFKLATLQEFGPERLKSQDADEMWSSLFRRWASTLDMIVWLDAPDTLLVQRINARRQRHAVKGKYEEEAYAFLKRYRVAYGQIIARLRSVNGPLLLEFDTSQMPVEQIATKVLATCTSKIGII